MSTQALKLDYPKIDKVNKVTRRLMESGVTFSFRHYRKGDLLLTEFHSHDAINCKRICPEFSIRLDDRQQEYCWLEIRH